MKLLLQLFALFLVIMTINARPQGPGCNCITTYEYRPVCGTDGRDYSNPSSVRCASQCEGRSVGVASYGRCVGGRG